MRTKPKIKIKIMYLREENNNMLVDNKWLVRY